MEQHVLKSGIDSITSIASKQFKQLAPPDQPCQLLQLNLDTRHLGLRGGGDKDFKPVIFTKKQPKPAAPPKSRADDDAVPLATVPHELKMAIMKARQVYYSENFSFDLLFNDLSNEKNSFLF